MRVRAEIDGECRYSQTRRDRGLHPRHGGHSFACEVPRREKSHPRRQVGGLAAGAERIPGCANNRYPLAAAAKGSKPGLGEFAPLFFCLAGASWCARAPVCLFAKCPELPANFAFCRAARSWKIRVRKCSSGQRKSAAAHVGVVACAQPWHPTLSLSASRRGDARRVGGAPSCVVRISWPPGGNRRGHAFAHCRPLARRRRVAALPFQFSPIQRLQRRKLGPCIARGYAADDAKSHSLGRITRASGTTPLVRIHPPRDRCRF